MRRVALPENVLRLLHLARGITMDHLAGRYWEPWLSFWRNNALLMVEPWDNALRAFAERSTLLPRRMVTLGLDPDQLARDVPSTVRDLVARCSACEHPERCEWELREETANLAWLSYCPNATTLMVLAGWRRIKVQKNRCRASEAKSGERKRAAFREFACLSG